eukprot:CAMPEP_0184685618 /NCGR_PEP_ID=MMETSP0312-20130426/19541_1 /TAXON_ID=31354 /ORGANISM="Compsopogon coeruleus, Strain SAG 36.94" /LENGTH=34 /DNA_ID= /DNA_START= /DNA_END= /DNA_ORIENTATION=
MVDVPRAHESGSERRSRQDPELLDRYRRAASWIG